MDTDRFKVVLNLHRMTNPVMSCELEKQFGCTGSQVRDEIRELRRSGVPVASSPHGYYMAQNYTEIEDTVGDLRSRAFSLLETSKALAKTFSVDLQGSLF